MRRGFSFYIYYINYMLFFRLWESVCRAGKILAAKETPGGVERRAKKGKNKC